MDNANHTEHVEHKHHILPLWVYLAVGGTLILMTGVTITAASIDFNALTGIGSMNFIIAMAIATFKALLVALIFMHLLYDNKFYLFQLGGAIACLLIFIALTMADTQFRGDVNAIEHGPIVDQVPKDKFVESKGHAPGHDQVEQVKEHK